MNSRITALIDPGTSFLEISPLAGYNVYLGEDVPAGGVIAGIGTVQGITCMLVANDSTYERGGDSVRMEHVLIEVASRVARITLSR